MQFIYAFILLTAMNYMNDSDQSESSQCSRTRIEAITLSLSLTVGRVEFLIARCSGF